VWTDPTPKHPLVTSDEGNESGKENFPGRGFPENSSLEGSIWKEKRFRRKSLSVK